MKDEYRIKHKNGTYYARLTGIGPCFGATREDAETFETQTDAARCMLSHSFAFVRADIERPDGTLVS